MMPTWNSWWYCRQKIIVWWRKTKIETNKEKNVHEMTLCKNYSMDPKRKATMKSKINCRICSLVVRDKKLTCTGNHKPLSLRWSPGTKHLIGRIQKQLLFHLQMMHWCFFSYSRELPFSNCSLQTPPRHSLHSSKMWSDPWKSSAARPTESHSPTITPVRKKVQNPAPYLCEDKKILQWCQQSSQVIQTWPCEG